MRGTLFVIDMQARFSSAEAAIPGVLTEMVRAMKRGDDIVIVEYHDEGSSLDVVMDACRHYGYVTVVKTKDNGAGALNKAGLLRKRRHLRFVGVNTCACVKGTVLGVMQRGYYKNVEVLLDGCHCDSTWRSPDECKRELEHIVEYAKANRGEYRGYEA